MPVLPYIYQGGGRSLRLADPDADDRRPGGWERPIRTADTWWSAFWLVEPYVQALFRPRTAVRSRCGRAVLVTLVTFLLPSFSILAGAPSSNRPMATCAFTAALYRDHSSGRPGCDPQPGRFFAYHVLWPRGLPGASTGYRLIGWERPQHCPLQAQRHPGQSLPARIGGLILKQP